MWYTTHLGFSVPTSYAPAFADVKRGALRLLLSGPKSSAGRPMVDDGERPGPGGSQVLIVGLPSARPIDGDKGCLKSVPLQHPPHETHRLSLLRSLDAVAAV